ncbi:CPBP family intramembrane metalloprotease [Prescottella equi]|uniref:CPBP family intramembrane metalloprotease n=1 Tax=Rhodococcus hoagii TaxID=43767 RepID=A0A9Q4ZT30_RHOHA|nr:CPBP family intramembrane glutamic endopeptidase [Prescottella equi]MBM4479592.1 CPBP family intramembrane metalloprotease [Prescottella equi]MBM4486868.1 CPBP family intramembrane metalloprotease [Prescottella equi]MBM4496203.1 CPBP family intramembrane metalloprotease [Prescottella equi]MBM4500233.1 CPBP family intramembrane metalloprotease [Prescottella equi]MBM4505420.1 CPBP family intramembrane metalloprotease [Prescottella equi]
MNIATANADTVSTTGIHRIRAAHAWLDVVVVVAVLVSTNLVAHFTTVWASIATVPIAAVVLVGLTRRRGLGWAELGLSPRHWRKGTVYALACVGLVLAVVAVGIALPFTRQLFMADRYATVSGALIASMIVIPLQTVIPEELAFRGVLQGTLSRVSGARGVFAAGSLLFGLWHIASSLGLTTGNRGLTGILGGGLMGQILGIAGAVAATAAAGFVFTWLRSRSGSLLAPIALHWSLNGIGALAAALVWHASLA